MHDNEPENDPSDEPREPLAESDRPRGFNVGKRIEGQGFKRLSDSLFPRIEPIAPRLPAPLRFEIPDVSMAEPDPSPGRTAENTERIAAHLEEMRELTRMNVRLSEESHAASARVEQFSRRMSIASFWVSLASLAAAIASIVVAVLSMSRP